MSAPALGATRSVKLHIDTLVLDGVAMNRRAGVIRALRAELDSLCADLSRRGAAVEARDARSAAAQFVPADSPEADGRAIARAIFQALRLERSERTDDHHAVQAHSYGGD